MKVVRYIFIASTVIFNIVMVIDIIRWILESKKIVTSLSIEDGIMLRVLFAGVGLAMLAALYFGVGFIIKKTV